MPQTDPRQDTQILPILPSLDIAETLEFYRGSLGFDQVDHNDGNYLIVRRAHMELHFWLTDDRSLCERTAIYIRGDGIDRLYAEFSEKSVAKLSPFTLRPWNMKEFYVWDPHGNLLKFGRRPTASEATDDQRPHQGGN